MIDLSYLTEEEQEMILSVLKRDAELKKAEQQRVKQLQKMERDKSKLKYMTGEWFYETKSQRHRDRIHGSDIIRASMRPRKPVTILELTKLWAEKPSFVNSENRDVFVPPELSGLIEEPPEQPRDEREDASPKPVPMFNREDASPKPVPMFNREDASPKPVPMFNREDASPKPVPMFNREDASPKPVPMFNREDASPKPVPMFNREDASPKPVPMFNREDVSPKPEVQQERLKPVVQPQIKQRPNPFNSEPIGEPDSEPDGAMEPGKTPAEELLPPSESHKAALTNLNSECSDTSQVTLNAPVPIPRKRTHIHSSQDSLLDCNQELLPPSESHIAALTNLNSECSDASHATLNAPVPIPRKRTHIHSSQDSLLDDGDPAPRWGGSSAPRGILKHNSSDSLLPPSPQSPPESPSVEFGSAGWLDRKQVRFASLVRAGGAEREAEPQDGRELGEHGLLDREGGGTLSDDEPETHESDAAHGSNGVSHGYSHEKLLEARVSPSASEALHGPFPALSSSALKPSTLESSVWSSRPPDKQDGVESGEFLSSREGTDMRGCDEGPTQLPTDQHEYHAEPHATHVSNLHAAAAEKGKPVAKRAGSLSHKLAEEEGHSIAKVLEWFGQGSGHSDRLEGKPCPQHEEETLEEPKRTDASDIDNVDSTRPQPVVKPSPTPRKGLREISSKAEVKEKSPEAQIPDQDGVSYPGERKDDVTLVCQAPRPTVSTEVGRHSNRPTVTGEVKQGTGTGETLIIKPDEESITPVSPANKEARQNMRESCDNSPSTLANLKSFWERGNRGPKILISKTSTSAKTSEPPNDAEGQKLVESDVRPLQAEHSFKTSESSMEDVITRYVPPQVTEIKQLAKLDHDTTDLRKSNNDGKCKEDIGIVSSPAISQHETSSGIDIFVIPSHEMKTSPYFDYSLVSSGLSGEQRAHKFKPSVTCKELPTVPDRLRISMPVSPLKHSTDKVEQKYTPVPPVRQSSLSQQDDRAANINNLKSFWEKEKTGPKIIFNNPKEASEIKVEHRRESSRGRIRKRLATSQFDLRTTSSDLGSDRERRSSSLHRERVSSGMMSVMERLSVKQSPTKSQFKNLREYQGGELLNQNDPFQTKMQSASTEDKPLSAKTSQPRVSSPGTKESTESNPQRDRLKLSSPRDQPKSPHRDSYRVKEARVDRCPLRSFDIDIGSHLKRVWSSSTPIIEKKGPSYGGMLSGLEASKVVIEKKIAYPQSQSGWSEQHHPPPPRRGSEQNPQFQVTSSWSPARSRSQPASSTENNRGQNCPQRSSDAHIGGPNIGQLVTSPEHFSRTSDAVWSGKPSMLGERKFSEGSELHPRLARSFIPQSYLHYLGIPEQTHVPLFSDRAERAERIRPQPGVLPGLEPQHGASIESSPSLPSQQGSEDVSYDSSRSSTPEAWSHSRASSACGNEDTSPVWTASKLKTSRSISISKSLEDITTLPTREERKKNDPRSELKLSVDDVSTAPSSPSSPTFSFSDPEKMKTMSTSVPDFPQQESNGRDSDSTSESSFHFGRQKRTGSSHTNFSSSSGMASMSSVSDSVMSIYSGDFGNVVVKGTIQFAINYIQKLGEFHIFVVQCRDLAVAEPKKDRSDPYVKCYLLPDIAKLGKRKTSVKKKTLNPTYNEILRYKIATETLKVQTLNLSVWHNDTFGRNSFLGEVDMDLSEWDFSDTQMNDYTLKGRTPSCPKPADHRGEMRVALRFLPQGTHSKRTPKTGEVQIWVKDCKNLPIVRVAAIDPFVKCTMLPDRSRKSLQKTRVVKKTANPVFNHTMVYDGFRPEDLGEACVELTAWDHDRLNNHFLGGLRLGLGTGKSYGAAVGWMDSNSEEATLWERMMKSQNEWVEDVLPLRMLMMARSMSK